MGGALGEAQLSPLCSRIRGRLCGWLYQARSTRTSSLSVEDKCASFLWFARAGPPQPRQAARWGDLL